MKLVKTKEFVCGILTGIIYTKSHLDELKKEIAVFGKEKNINCQNEIDRIDFLTELIEDLFNRFVKENNIDEELVELAKMEIKK